MPAGGRGLMQAFFMLRGNIMVEKGGCPDDGQL